MFRLIAFVLPLALLAGCTLIDQNTFAPSPEVKPPPPVVMPPVETRSPLIVIAYTSTPKEYTKPLSQAVRAAQKLKHDIDYDVVGIAPKAAAGPPGSNEAALQEAGAHAAEVMRAVMTQGVPAARIHLSVRTSPDATVGDVRVYVR